MSSLNIMIFVLEDNENLFSPFMHDLPNLLNKSNNIPINIMYYSRHLFGSQIISISKDTYVSKKVPNIKDEYKTIKSKIEELYNSCYVKGKQNILYFGGHSLSIFKDNRRLHTNIFENISGLELLIFDSCYTSYTTLLSTVINKTKYVLGCETSSPYVGYLSEQFLQILNTKLTNKTKYKKIIDAYIERNNNTDDVDKKLNYRTDGTLIDMTRYVDLYEYIKDQEFIKDKKCKVEKNVGYYFYDLSCVGKNKEIDDLIKGCVIYQKMSKSCKEHFKTRKIVLSGMLVSII